MISIGLGTGLTPVFPSPVAAPAVAEIVTEEAAVRATPGRPLAVTPLVAEGDMVARGAAVACLRHAPDICLTAPLAGRVARISLLPGSRLSEIVIFREDMEATERHDPASAESPGGLRRLMQASGVWPLLRRRPFGGMPGPQETPSAIVVMAADTRPLAPDPLAALDGHEADLTRGLAALARLTEGPVLLCQTAKGPHLGPYGVSGHIRADRCGARHPQGLAGIRIHKACPAGLDAPVWDIHAEDAAALGGLLRTGELPVMRRVHIAGAGLREARTVMTHPGADLRQLTQRITQPGPHTLISGSPLDGHVARWLAPRDRQVTVLPRVPAARPRPHWLVGALTRSATARPAIPSAALDQAMGGALPALPLIRALAAGDDETAMSLGVLSLLEEDLALADYVLSETNQLKSELRAMLDRIETEFAA